MFCLISLQFLVFSPIFRLHLSLLTAMGKFAERVKLLRPQDLAALFWLVLSLPLCFVDPGRTWMQIATRIVLTPTYFVVRISLLHAQFDIRRMNRTADMRVGSFARSR